MRGIKRCFIITGCAGPFASTNLGGTVRDAPFATTRAFVAPHCAPKGLGFRSQFIKPSFGDDNFKGNNRVQIEVHISDNV